MKKAKGSKKPPARKPKPKPRPKPKPQALRHDTPVDVPAVSSGLAPIAFDPRAQADAALARVRKLETIEAAYEAWAELRAEHSGTVSRLSDERKQLEQQGQFLVGAVRAARDLTKAPTIDEALALAKGGGIDAFVAETASRLEAAQKKVEEKSRAVEVAFGDAFAQIREELRSRIVRTLAHVKPKLRLMMRSLGGDQRILHVARLDPDEAVLLAWVLLARLPSRYDYLFDDSTDDATRAPPTLYAEEGVSSALVRPTVDQLQQLMAAESQVLPIKGVIPFWLPQPGAAPQLARLVERGPVMEVELVDAGAFRNVLTKDEAERAAGYFLRLKLEQRLEIELSGS